MAVRLVLASASPRRREILSYLDLPFQVQPADVDETPLSGEAPEEMVLRLSRAKAAALMANLNAADTGLTIPGAAGLVVIAADTTVVLDGLNIGKPTDAADAERILRKLRGRMHQVFTGLTLASAAGRPWSALCETHVFMRAYDDRELKAYVDSGQAYDKAGAYGVQDPLFQPVERIEGCYLNVMGLPLCELIRGLRVLGLQMDIQEPVLHDTLNVKG